MKVQILDRSSSGGSYPVEFSDESGVLRVTCKCQAGLLHQVCKHKLALLRGDSKMLFDPTQDELLHRVLALPAYSLLRKRVDEYEQALAAVEMESAKLKQREKRLKTDFARELADGERKG